MSKSASEKNSSGSHENRDESIEQSAIKLLLAQSLKSIIVSAVAVCLCFAMLGVAAPELDMRLWFYVALSVVFIRSSHWVITRHHAFNAKRLRSYSVTCFLSGFSWGLLAFYWTSYLPLGAQIILIMFPLAMTVGAVSAYGAHVRTFIGFAVAAQVPLMFVFLSSGDSAFVQLSLPTVLFFVAQILLVKSYNQQLIESIRLKITNQELIEDLSAHNAELEVARDEAQLASVAKTEFLARMSHEIRTPMHAVLGMTDLLRKTQMDSHQQGIVKTLKSSGESLLKLINDLLDVSKIEAGSLELEVTSFNLNAMIRSLMANQKVLSDSKGLQLEYSIDKRLPECIVGDSHRLSQVLTNLSGNAIKFTDTGKVSIDICKLEIDAKPMLCIEVSDTGAGIEQGRIDTIFDVFQQADGSITRRFGGTGLGLSIARDFIKAMDGEITVSSQLGHGSTFRVLVPLVELEEGLQNDNVVSMPRTEVETESKEAGLEPSTASVDYRSSLRKFKGLHILIAEDNLVNQMLMEAMLDEFECEVCVANNGEEALEELQSKTFDIVFMDCQMPVLDGFNATKQAREKGVELPIIAVTANAMQGDKAACLAAGMSDYVAKPFESQTIFNMLEKWCGGNEESKAA